MPSGEVTQRGETEDALRETAPPDAEAAEDLKRLWARILFYIALVLITPIVLAFGYGLAHGALSELFNLDVS